jgi:hypothetical protein
MQSKTKTNTKATGTRIRDRGLWCHDDMPPPAPTVLFTRIMNPFLVYKRYLAYASSPGVTARTTLQYARPHVSPTPEPPTKTMWFATPGGAVLKYRVQLLCVRFRALMYTFLSLPERVRPICDGVCVWVLCLLCK